MQRLQQSHKGSREATIIEPVHQKECAPDRCQRGVVPRFVQRKGQKTQQIVDVSGRSQFPNSIKASYCRASRIVDSILGKEFPHQCNILGRWFTRIAKHQYRGVGFQAISRPWGLQIVGELRAFFLGDFVRFKFHPLVDDAKVQAAAPRSRGHSNLSAI